MKIKLGQEEAYKETIEINSKDSYSKATIDFMVRWADLMEEEINKGYGVSKVAEDLARKADTEGISGFMYGCAVNLLSQLWEYGEDLRKWHNGEYNYGGDGVVNPAIISIET